MYCGQLPYAWVTSTSKHAAVGCGQRAVDADASLGGEVHHDDPDRLTLGKPVQWVADGQRVAQRQARRRRRRQEPRRSDQRGSPQAPVAIARGDRGERCVRQKSRGTAAQLAGRHHRPQPGGLRLDAGLPLRGKLAAVKTDGLGLGLLTRHRYTPQGICTMQRREVHCSFRNGLSSARLRATG